jgi:hypothetical protein
VILAAKGMGAATPTFISTKPNITAVYPFKQAGIIEADVYRILDEAGLGLPSNLICSAPHKERSIGKP